MITIVTLTLLVTGDELGLVDVGTVDFAGFGELVPGIFLGAFALDMGGISEKGMLDVRAVHHTLVNTTLPEKISRTDTLFILFIVLICLGHHPTI